MRSTLTPEHLAQLHTEGVAEARRSPFVNPFAVAEARRIMGERGEDWATDVLMRGLDRRAAIDPSMPWFKDGEMETLILADRAEWQQLDRAAQNPAGTEGDLA